MTAQTLEEGDTGGAVLSPDRVYRYDLTRTWDESKLHVLWVMLNPSTADEVLLDATLRRTRGFSRSWGYGGMTIRNLYALRSTDPRALYTHHDPVGPDNDKWLAATTGFGLVVCGWGNHGRLYGRGRKVLQLLKDAAPHAALMPQALRLTGSRRGAGQIGQPSHPLYLPKTLEPFPL